MTPDELLSRLADAERAAWTCTQTLRTTAETLAPTGRPLLTEYVRGRARVAELLTLELQAVRILARQQLQDAGQVEPPCPCGQGRTFTCKRCERARCWCRGASDCLPDLCDDCWHQVHAAAKQPPPPLEAAPAVPFAFVGNCPVCGQLSAGPELTHRACTTARPDVVPCGRCGTPWCPDDAAEVAHGCPTCDGCTAAELAELRAEVARG